MRSMSLVYGGYLWVLGEFCDVIHGLMEASTTPVVRELYTNI